MGGDCLMHRGWRIEPGRVGAEGVWTATHEDYDGAPDAYDGRYLRGFDSVEAARVGVDEWESDFGEPEPQYGEWVSVGDAMPPAGKTVLAWGFTGWLITDLPIMEPFRDRHHVTHWTPLPPLAPGMEDAYREARSRAVDRMRADRLPAAELEAPPRRGRERSSEG